MPRPLPLFCFGELFFAELFLLEFGFDLPEDGLLEFDLTDSGLVENVAELDFFSLIFVGFLFVSSRYNCW